MRRLLKGKAILLFALMSVLIATPVLAWVVYSNGIANVSLTVRRAEASWEEVEIEIGPVDSGANFSATDSTVLTVENAERLYMTFQVITFTDEELAAIEIMVVAVGEDTNGDGGIDVPWGTIEISKDQGIGGWPSPIPVSKGDHNVVILVAGAAGYPEVETPIGFVVEGTCETLPVPVP